MKVFSVKYRNAGKDMRKTISKEKQACEVDIKLPTLSFRVSWSYFKKAQLDASTLNYNPVSVASWELMCSAGPLWT